jgi:outer membrane protein assembly factor BamB
MGLIIAVIVLLGIAGMFWLFTDQLALAPTPTPTQTPGSPVTATADFRATQVVEDMLTQEAERIAAGGTPMLTPSPSPTSTLSPTLSGALNLTTSTPTEVIVSLPIVSTGGGGTPTPTETQVAAASPLEPPLATPLFTSTGAVTTSAAEGLTPAAATPVALSPLGTPTANLIVLPIVSHDAASPQPPTPIPAQLTPTLVPQPPTEVAGLPPTPAQTQPPTPIPPTPSATQTQPPTPIPYTVPSLRAVVRDLEREVRIGPSNPYTVTGFLDAGDDVNILGRTPSGEWVFICCAIDDENRNNITAWMRRVYLDVRDNSLGQGAPEGADPNDVRWLSVYPTPALQPPLMTPTPIPANDFPLYRYTSNARARLPDLPNPPVDYAWPNQAQAGAALISPVIVSGSSVLVASADNHLYSFDRLNGNQRWRYDFDQPVRYAPVVRGSTIYAVDQSGRLFALEDRGNEAVPVWENPLALAQPPISGLNIYSGTLLLYLGNATTHQLYAVDSVESEIIDFTSPTNIGSGPRYPVLGDQLVYVYDAELANTDGSLAALDINDLSEIWRLPDVVSPTSLPIYAWPGVEAVADLYIAGSDNRIYSIDANTGSIRWSFDNGEMATGLAANGITLFISGDGYVKAVSRDTNELFWRTPVSGQVLGGPFVDGEQVIVFTASGSIHFLNAATGNVNNSAVIPAQANAPGAISGEWLFVPGANGTLYALREAQ